MAQLSQRQIRQQCRDRRSLLTAAERAINSQKIYENVVGSSWFRCSNYVACYLSAHAEVSTWSIVERAKSMKKRIFAPVIEKNRLMRFREINADSSLQRNEFGLLEPKKGLSIDVRRLDVVITPIVAFDSHRHRIGMGGGYFDRTFSFLRHRRCYYRPKLVGVAFACQEVAEIPANPWDIRVCSIVTENS